MPSTLDEITLIEAEAGRISQLLRSHDLETPIGHLGRWKVQDVAAHLGGIYRWATRIVETRSMDGPSFTKSKLRGEELCDWFDASAAGLLDAFAANDRAAECENFNPGSDKTVAWWQRRQLHETTIHRWDVEKALDCLSLITTEVAADGIDEFLDVFIRTRGKQTLTGPLLLSTVTPAQSWILTPAQKAGRVDINADGAATPTTELTGPPGDLLLHLWGRLSLSEIDATVTGDQAIAESLMPR